MIMFLAFILFPFVPLGNFAVHTNNFDFFFGIAREIGVGLVIGLAVQFMFAGIQIAGQLMDYQMGFGFVNVVDPESKLQIPLMGQFLYIMAVLLFFLINGHHWVIRAVERSFQVIPLDGSTFRAALPAGFIHLATEAFVVGFNIGAPLVMTLFLIDLAYGVIARTVPQANIMVVGFPLKIGLGLFFSVVSLPLFFMVIKRFFTQALLNLNLLLKLM
jgi:flagellar biosynthesis protein FliR